MNAPQCLQAPPEIVLQTVRDCPKSRDLKTTACDPEQSTIDLVNGAQLDKLLESMDLGRKIQALRLEHLLSLVDLSKLCKLSASYLSQLERGRVCPTVKNLARLALVFKKDLSHFFHHGEGSFFRISREKDRVRLALGLRNVPVLIMEDMSGLIPSGNLIPYITEIVPGGHGSCFEPERFFGMEFIYLLSGSTSVARAKQSTVLEAGDVLWIDGNTPRQYRCLREAPARLMVMSFVNHGAMEQAKLGRPEKPKHRRADHG